MSLSVKQKGVRNGIIVGMGITLLVLIGGAITNPFSFPHNLAVIYKLTLAIKAAAAPTFFLALSVAALARDRFFNPADIDGGALSTHGSAKAKILQSILQNTLDESVLAIVVYLFWATVMPSELLSVISCAAILFVLGRILFALGYAKGAPARSIGFALTFFPTVLMFVTSLLTVGYKFLDKIF